MSKADQAYKLLFIGCGLAFIVAFLVIYSDHSSSLSAILEDSKAIRMSLTQVATSLEDSKKKLFSEQNDKLDTVLLKLNQMNEKQQEITEKLGEHDTEHSSMRTRVEDKVLEQEQLRERIDLHNNQHTEIEDTFNFQDNKHKALSEALEKHALEEENILKTRQRHFSLRGVQLSSPWNVTNNRVSIGSSYLWTIDSHNYIKFAETKTPKKVVILVGPSVATEDVVSNYLRVDKTLHVFVLSPTQNRLKDPNVIAGSRVHWIPALVYHGSGYQPIKNLPPEWVKDVQASHVPGQYPVIRLEQLLGQINPEIPVDLVRVGAGVDFSSILTSGAHINQLKHVIMHLQDLPATSPKKHFHGQSNTTRAKEKLARRGLALQCCSCVNAQSWEMECFFGRGNDGKIKNWDPVFKKVEPDAAGKCDKGFDKETGEEVELPESVWSMPLCGN
eukprot:TRINITY_DN17223_c0_g1_i1.p1 TRINITY_DN17223_c0_g1~~TRINITY_DN17223_c0_g1_i1.p1  ORF type:complete len:444 (+),score=23.40 TRINITY_DN17223_c0_g1_i1:74-1405(+)